MSAPKPYNGHHCWNCWNVALWIGNDEGLYRAAIECRRRPRANGTAPSLNVAATRFLAFVGGGGLGGAERTPDGAIYTRKAVKAALAEYEQE